MTMGAVEGIFSYPASALKNQWDHKFIHAWRVDFPYLTPEIHLKI